MLADESYGEPQNFWRLRIPATESELIEHCRARLAHYKAPRRVVFGVLPRTSTGKIQKFVLRDLAAAPGRGERGEEA